ncbi:MAG TPA: fibronectin type III domain-containing protein, partial [Mycobacteriales bacterium]|nr:fibronectin type III domain-containing protein [Mycobacteriales bacterium]
MSTHGAQGTSQGRGRTRARAAIAAIGAGTTIVAMAIGTAATASAMPAPTATTSSVASPAANTSFPTQGAPYVVSQGIGTARVAYFPQVPAGATGVHYVVTATDVSRGPKGSTVTTTTTSNAATLDGLVDGEVYDVTLTVTTDNMGSSAPSNPLTLRTVPASPNGLSVAWVKPGEARVAYYPQRYAGAQVLHYTVTATDVTDPSAPVITETTRSNSAKLTGLIDGDVYQVTATTTSTVGTSAPSKPLTLRTVPASPGGLYTSWVKPGEARVGYFPQRSAGADIVNYTMTATDVTDPSAPVITKTTRSNSAVLTGLIDGDVYHVTVTATSTVGTSAPSTTYTLRTVPAAPGGLSVAWTKPGEARIAYYPQRSAGAEILNYTLTATDVTDASAPVITATTRSNSAVLTGLVDGHD